MPDRPWAIAGTVPGEHTLDAIRARLIDHPRERHFAVVELRNTSTTIDHPEDDEDAKRVTITMVAIDPITIPDDVNSVRSARDRARLNRPGQATMDEAQASTGNNPDIPGRRTGADDLALRRQAAGQEGNE